jgi:hypothetical protein
LCSCVQVQYASTDNNARSEAGLAAFESMCFCAGKNLGFRGLGGEFYFSSHPQLSLQTCKKLVC